MAKITEYTVVYKEGKQLSGTTWKNYRIKLGENLYYRNHDPEKIEFAEEDGWAMHIVGNNRGKLHAERVIELLKERYDENGIRKEV